MHHTHTHTHTHESRARGTHTHLFIWRRRGVCLLSSSQFMRGPSAGALTVSVNSTTPDTHSAICACTTCARGVVVVVVVVVAAVAAVAVAAVAAAATVVVGRAEEAAAGCVHAAQATHTRCARTGAHLDTQVRCGVVCCQHGLQQDERQAATQAAQRAEQHLLCRARVCVVVVGGWGGGEGHCTSVHGCQATACVHMHDRPASVRRASGCLGSARALHWCKHAPASSSWGPAGSARVPPAP
jgi:hypothetical protein